METADRIVIDDEGPEDRPNPETSSPIVIVQRGRSSIARDVLLVALLLPTLVFLLYREFLQEPSVIIREAPRPGSLVVDARPIAPVDSGDVVLRVSDRASASGPDTPAPPSSPAPGTEAPSGSTDPAEPEPSEIGRAPDAWPASEPDVDSPALLAQSPESDPNPDPESEPEPAPNNEVAPGSVSPVDRDEATPDEPVVRARANSEILWRVDPGDGREETPSPDGNDRRGGGLDPQLVERKVPDRRVPREIPAPTMVQRRHFLKILSDVTRKHGLEAGPLIDRLCYDFQADLPPEVDRIDPDILRAMLSASGPKFSRTIIALRRLGAPEPYLLERLTEQMHRLIGVRQGPRDPMEARVFAARKLLSVPLQ